MSIRLTATHGMEARRPGLLDHAWRLVGHLVSFEMLFVLYLLSPAFKADPRLAFVPVDITLLTFAMSVGLGLLVIVRERIYLNGLTIGFAGTCFLFWGIISYTWTLGNKAALQEALQLGSLVLWCLLATSLIIANRPERVVRFLALICIVAVLLSADSLYTYLTARGYFHIGAVKRAYLNYGRVMGLGLIIAFTAMTLARNGWQLRLIGLGIFSLCFFALFIGGGRGPLLAALIPLILPLMLGLELRRGHLGMQRSQIWVALALAGAAMALVYIISTGDNRLRTVGRLITLFTAEDGGGSAAGRLNYFTVAFENWWRAPWIGHGLGSFSVLFFGTEIQGTYPHNIVLEVLVELGLVGLVLLLVTFWVALRRLSFQRLRSEPLLLCALMLLMNTVLNAAVTNDLPGNRAVFAMLGLLAMRPLLARTDDDAA